MLEKEGVQTLSEAVTLKLSVEDRVRVSPVGQRKGEQSVCVEHRGFRLGPAGDTPMVTGHVCAHVTFQGAVEDLLSVQDILVAFLKKTGLGFGGWAGTRVLVWGQPFLDTRGVLG